MRLLALTAALVLCAGPAGAAPPAAIYRDPAPDPRAPATMRVLHVPVQGVAINGIAYLPTGPGPHPVLVLCHGLPGNEKNLDLAQAARRAGWVAVTFNYRGSWGSPGTFSFSGNLEDAAAVLAYLRDPAHAAALRADSGRIAIAGHSMGGWVAARVAAREPALRGALLISAADIGRIGALPHEQAVALMADNMEALAGVTAESMAREVEGHQAEYSLLDAAAGLARMPLLVLSSDDGLAPASEALVRAVRVHGGARVRSVHVATDHGWSDHRIALQSLLIRWLGTLH